MESNIKTFFLLGALSFILIFFGGFIAGRSGIYIAFIFSLVIDGISYFYSDKIALMANGAKPISEGEAPLLYRIVRELSKQMNIPFPALYITPQLQANAFATGRNPQHASVAVTEGLMNLLSDDEIKAVIAHELGHVKNRDILISSIAAVLASSISFIANMGMFGFYGNDNRDRNGILELLGIIFIPISASLIQLAISRQREFEADRAGALIMGSGKPLANALLAISNSAMRNPMMNGNAAFSSLYIANPLGGVSGNLMRLFSTHPPVEERVKRLLSV